MGSTTSSGTVKTENVIWFVVASLLIGFIGGVAFGVYKTGSIVDPHQAPPPVATDEARQQTIDALVARVQANPGDLEAWIQLGHQYFDLDRADAAIAAYEKALAIDAGNADVWTDLGVMYRRSNKPRKAIEAFDRAMQINPRHEISRFNKGIVLFHDLNDEQGALESWESLLAINPQAKTPGGETVRELVEHIKNEHQEKK